MTEISQQNNKDITLLILTYKGKHHLEYLLPTVKKAIGFVQEKTNVLIVDNGCDNATKQFVNEEFPDFDYQFSPVNDYLFSLNIFVRKLKTEFVFILNDDMKLHPLVIKQLHDVARKDKKLFSVTSNIMDWDGSYTAAFVRKMKYSRGWLRSFWDKSVIDDKLRYTLYGGGGAAIFRTQMFNELEGFNSLYRPAYCEDLDLGHRAWHRGWKSVYNPAAILYHREGGTINNQFKADKLEQAIYKNQIIWMLRNATKKSFLPWFFILLPYRLLTGWKISKNANLALWRALLKIPRVLFERFRGNNDILSDDEIISILGTEYKLNNNK